jgi:hypothetical protein
MKLPPWSAALAITVALLGSIAQSHAAGGSFMLCYDRLSQLAALHQAQGGKVTVVVDEPNQREYIVKLRYGANDKEMSCSRKGELLVEGREKEE